MPTHPAYKVIPVWQKDLMKLVRLGHSTKVAAATLNVGYDRLLNERRRNAEFDEELAKAEQEGREKGSRRFTF